ncbi:GGDEF and EAL domain-containing protein [Sphingomonas sp. IC4-52]|uniref:sensor domain-containing phosphodiesterase n=1 Tax=Sphingomonas sp. IC4-52 TaxID=2887202 RepID=UPI001D12883F|nr:GGDEF and EAL domain-containing protein [Sphingomonas sp. IC4-52]MCC2981003.1 GGDEF and EAL domain-containing protein [Sphingomonas sp. IC4-52]
MAHCDEEARLDALYQLNLLNTPPSESFDRITRMASQLFGLPISAVSLTDRDRQWFKSRVGVEHSSIPREKAPCAQVAESVKPVLIPDLLADECYADSLLAGQGIRFYAGAPLTTRDGFGLGALCVLGTEPREATDVEMAALHDLAQMAMSQIELQHAFGRVDPLSGLPNLTQFLDDLDDLGRDEPGRDRLAVLIELARTEQISAGVRVLGTAFFEDMVQDAARSLRAGLGPHRRAYHIAPTQFAYLALPENSGEPYLQQLSAGLQRPRTGPTAQFLMSATIGVAPFVTGRTPPRDVLRHAHSAALDARESRTGVSLYSASADAAHRRRFALLRDFGAALDCDDQLSLVYQPRIDLRSGRCVGAEALLRWAHPVLGAISPAEFMPLVEQTSLARATTAKVLDTALSQLGRWQRANLDIQLSVNVSATNLNEDDFSGRVQLQMLKHRIVPANLELEVTESAIMGEAGAAIAQLDEIAATGARLAIDDFGTGHSSLAYLQRLPAHVVKIDQSFIRGLDDGERERTLVRSMISLSHDLGYRVVAEGVETAAIADLLCQMGCDEAQGFYFARPLSPDAFDEWMATHNPAQAAA